MINKKIGPQFGKMVENLVNSTQYQTKELLTLLTLLSLAFSELTVRFSSMSIWNMVLVVLDANSAILSIYWPILPPPQLIQVKLKS